MSKKITFEDKEILKLTEWEVANFHLPPVTTVTLYEGVAPVEFLHSRITRMLEKNPWLTSRIVKKPTTDGVPMMAYSKKVDVESALSQHFSVYEPRRSGIFTWHALCRTRPLFVARPVCTLETGNG